MHEPQNPLISVVTVCFNSEKTIERTIQSVLSQKFQNFELIIIDGKSVDSTIEIIHRYDTDPKLKCFSEKDHGIYDAMNKGVQKARGRYIHFLNADDVLVSPTVYHNIASSLVDEEMIYHAKLKYCHDDGHIRILGHAVQENDLRFGLKGIHQPVTFFPRILFQRHGLFHLKYKISSDYDLIRRFCSHAKTSFIDEVAVEMADGGASALQIQTACLENRAIAVSFGESKVHVLFREYVTRFGLFLRKHCPRLFHFLYNMKNILSTAFRRGRTPHSNETNGA